MTRPAPTDAPATPGSPDFTGLRATYVNCTLNRSPGRSRTQGGIDHSSAISEPNGGVADRFRAVDHDSATGVRPDRTEHGVDTDAWPALRDRVLAADILVIGGPIGLGDNSSVTKRVIERLYG
ncbi:hypothetical protein [Microbacterium sp. HSID17254]|uniref:hypothetical protein n=1 Tax=Microbacterium sp. HSID17254 TaxID=2419509 RepID=UPI001930F708|nr:hypothetical protein [Microbacterium sp. HSID17254]